MRTRKQSTANRKQAQIKMKLEKKGGACYFFLRRDGRVVEGTGLENRHGSNVIGGSNPSLSAKKSSA